jgi:hypothetical protein
MKIYFFFLIFNFISLLFKYATEPNLAKYRQLLASDYAKKYIKSETLMKLLQLPPDVLRLIRFTPAQVIFSRQEY